MALGRGRRGASGRQAAGTRAGRAMAIDTAALRDQRAAAERDVLACGMLLHQLLAGAPALGVRRHRARRSRAWRRTGASSCACRGRRRSRSPTRCARSSTARPRVSRGCAIAMRARCSARSSGWLEARTHEKRRPGRAAARPPAQRRPPAGAARAGDRASSGSRRSRASAPTRSRASSCPTWRSSFELLRTLNSAQRAGHADRRQRAGADLAPRRRADRRRRRSRGRHRFAPGRAPLDDAARARASQRRSTASASPATSRRRCARRLRRAKSSTWSRCCRTSAGCWCATTSPTRPSRSSS